MFWDREGQEGGGSGLGEERGQQSSLSGVVSITVTPMVLSGAFEE